MISVDLESVEDSLLELGYQQWIGWVKRLKLLHGGIILLLVVMLGYDNFLADFIMIVSNRIV